MKTSSLAFQPVVSRRDHVFRCLRPLLEALGIDWLSRPALSGLDRKLENLLPQRGGWFVEAGAYDGFHQSNTYAFARLKGWRGVLIEPVPELAELCRRQRPESQTVCCALGPPEEAGQILQLRQAGLMTMARGTFGDEAQERERAMAGLSIQGLPTAEVFVEAAVRTLTEVLTETGTPRDFDLLSLDVEGMEVRVLRGLDLQRFRPKALCIEVRHAHFQAVVDQLQHFYAAPIKLTSNEHYADCFFARLPAD